MTEQSKNNRILLDECDRIHLFNALSLSYSWQYIANHTGYTVRTINAWKNGKTTIPYAAFVKLFQLSELEQPLPYTSVSVSEQRSRAGKLGGRVAYERYGLGDRQSRRKGGKQSYAHRKTSLSDIFTRQRLSCPSPSIELAEFIGIMLGDGSLSAYQTSVCCNTRDDADYIKYVSSLMHSLFGVRPKHYVRASSNCTVLVISSIELREQLVGRGLILGDKIKGGLHVPRWVKDNPDYMRLCLRGMFDTDGGIYLERHKRKSGRYEYPRMAFVSASEPLVQDIVTGLTQLGFRPKIRQSRYVVLDKFTDIQQYFTIVGSSNLKHLTRYAQFGGVG